MGRTQSRAMALLCCGGIALFAACGDEATGPRSTGPLTVEVRITSVSQPELGATSQGVATIACLVDLSATADGPGSATWQDAVFRWYRGNLLASPFDSAVISSIEVARSWGNGGIANRDPELSRWQFSASLPFSASLEFHYQANGVTETTRAATFTCSPPVPAHVPAPTITALEAVPAGGEIEPGDTLQVSYTATAPAGLWQTLVAITGACDTAQFVPGQLAQTGSYTVRLPIPHSCTLGASLTVSVVAIDAAVQRTSIAPTGPINVVDHTPPELTVFGNDGARMVSGDYFAGDTIHLVMAASDNHELRSVVWEVQPAGVRDSLRVTGPFVGPGSLPVPVRASWGPTAQFSFVATDAVGNVSAVAAFNSDSLRLYPDTPRPTAWTTVAGDTRDICPDSKRGVFYVLLGNQRRLLTLSLSDATPVRSLDFPSFVTSFDFTPSGDSLLLTYPSLRALGVLDLTTPVPLLSMLPLITPDSSQGQTPQEVRTTSNGKAFMHLQGPTLAHWQLLEVDLATGVETLRLDAGSGGVVENSIERSPGHGFLVTGNGVGTAQVYNAATNQFGPLTQLTIPGGVFNFSTDGQVMSYGLQILDASLQLVRRVRSTVGGGVAASFLAPDGQSLYYVESRGLIRTRVSDGAVVERSRLPIPIAGIRVSDDGQWAVYHGLPGSTSGQVGVIDLR